MQIDFSGSTLCLEWQDDSSEISVPSAVAYYDVFYRELGTLKWNSLSSTDGPLETVTIDNNETGYGKFEFAVQAVYNNNKKSDLHKSIDFSAWPVGGWFINWYQEE